MILEILMSLLRLDGLTFNPALQYQMIDHLDYWNIIINNI